MDLAGIDADGDDMKTYADHYTCGWEGCQQTLPTQQQLVDHVTAQHVQLASTTYRCLWRGCSRRRQGFNARYKMFVHIRTHTKERPHVCFDCGKGFSRQENLKIHKRSHTGEKPYACTFEGCDRAYSNSSDRFKHTRTHYVDRPYGCRFPGCSKSYTDPSSLRKHMKANGHSRPPSPEATPPPDEKPDKLKADARLEMAMKSGAGDSAAAKAAPVQVECVGCVCGARPTPLSWEGWLWYPWVQHVGHLLHCPTAGGAPHVFGGHGGGPQFPQLADAAGVSPALFAGQPAVNPAPLDLRVPPN